MLPYGLYYLGFGGRELNKDQKIYCKVSHWPSLLFPILLFFFLLEIIKLSLARNNNLLQQIQLYIYMYSVHKHHCHLFT